MTGGTAGIGFGIVAHLLQHNASKIIILSQKEEHAREAIEELKNYGDANKAEWRQCNFNDLKQTDGVVKQLKQEKQIDAVSKLHQTHAFRWKKNLKADFPDRLAHLQCR